MSLAMKQFKLRIEPITSQTPEQMLPKNRRIDDIDNLLSIFASQMKSPNVRLIKYAPMNNFVCVCVCMFAF